MIKMYLVLFMLYNIHSLQGRIQDFKLGGGVKIFAVFHVKNHIFSNFRGGGAHRVLCPCTPLSVLFSTHGTCSINLMSEKGSWSWSYDSWIYYYLCNQCLSPKVLLVRIPTMVRCTRYYIMWYSLSVTCGRTSVVFSGYSGFLHQ